jgi:hypothetical protein
MRLKDSTNLRPSSCPDDTASRMVASPKVPDQKRRIRQLPGVGARGYPLHGLGKHCAGDSTLLQFQLEQLLVGPHAGPDVTHCRCRHDDVVILVEQRRIGRL